MKNRNDFLEALPLLVAFVSATPALAQNSGTKGWMMSAQSCTFLYEAEGKGDLTGTLGSTFGSADGTFSIPVAIKTHTTLTIESGFHPLSYPAHVRVEGNKDGMVVNIAPRFVPEAKAVLCEDPRNFPNAIPTISIRGLYVPAGEKPVQAPHVTKMICDGAEYDGGAPHRFAFDCK